nr:hypothetical protein [Tanacetum cinerariifolium]
AARLRWRAEREEIPKANLPLWKRLCTAHTGTYELGESFAAAAARLREPVRCDLYRFVNTVERGEGSTPNAIERVTELSTTFNRETSMIYAMIEEKKDDKALQRARVNRSQISDYSRDTAGGDQGVAGSTPQVTGIIHTGTDYTEVMSDSADCSSRTHSDLRGHQSPSTARGTGGETSMIYAMIEEKKDDQALQRARVNRLFRDMRFHAHTARLMEGEARASQNGTKKTTRANPTTTTTTITTFVTDAQLEALIEQGIAKALAARNADRNTNGDDSHVSRTGARRTKWVTRECTYLDFMNNCSMENQIKFFACTLPGSALTWWNSYVMTVGPDAAYAMTWEADKIERYISGLLDVIHRSVVASRPKTMAYTAGSGEKKPYKGPKPLCPKCNYHYDGPCAPKSYKCNKVGHIACDCRGTANGGNATTPARVYAVGRAGTNPDSNVVTGTFLLNNRYASILFDTGADRNFVSTAFSSQIAIIPTTLDQYYDIELADGRIIRLNSILRGCTLNFLNHPFC